MKANVATPHVEADTDTQMHIRNKEIEEHRSG